MAAISISWSDLAKVAEVSAAFAIGIVIVFAVGIIGLARWEASRQPEAGEATASSGAGSAGVVLAGVCFLACLAAGAFGIYLIVPQWGG